MTRKELLLFVDEVMSKMLKKANGKKKKKLFYCEMAPAPGNGVTVTLYIKITETAVNDDGSKTDRVTIVKCRTETVYAIQGYEIIEDKLRKSFMWYFLK